MRSVPGLLRTGVVLSILTVFSVSVGADETLENKIRPPLPGSDAGNATITSRIMPPIGASSEDGNPYERPENKIRPPLPTAAEPMTGAERFWSWLFGRIRPPLPLQ
jgi:hypothetical protein